MNEEEKDSVKILNNTELDINTIYSVDLHTYNYAVKTVLNLIEKQQTEIEKLKKHNKDLLRKLRNRVKEVKKLTKYSLYKNEFTKLNKQIAQYQNMLATNDMLHVIECEKKDKIINELKAENHELKEKLQMFIPRRRVRRIYKIIGKILRTDIDPIILEKELKAEYKIEKV